MEMRDYSENIISLIFQKMDKAGERLTSSNLNLCKACLKGPICALFYNPCPAKLIYTKLSRYEDTGLAPEEITTAPLMPLPASSKEET